jgi:hypothetical protein
MDSVVPSPHAVANAQSSATASVRREMAGLSGDRLVVVKAQILGDIFDQHARLQTELHSSELEFNTVILDPTTRTGTSVGPRRSEPVLDGRQRTAFLAR